MKKILWFAVILICAALCVGTFGYGEGLEIGSRAHAASLPFSKSEEIELPIVMYHSVLKSKKGKYTIHPDELERDIVRYIEMGYTPVTLRAVADWVGGDAGGAGVTGVGGGADLPEKPMVITFDDGHYNNLYYALPILKKHGCPAVVNVVTSFSRFSSETAGEAHNPNYSSLTWDDIRELHDSGLVEIGNHTHAMHKFKPRYGIAQVSGETVDAYRQAIKTDLETANRYLVDSARVPCPITFAYPFGKYTREGREVLQELGFRAILTCNEGVSKIRRGDPTSLLELKRYNRSGNEGHERFMKRVFG